MRASRVLRERGRHARLIERDILGRMVGEVLPSLVRSMATMNDTLRLQRAMLQRMHSSEQESTTMEGNDNG